MTTAIVITKATAWNK